MDAPACILRHTAIVAPLRVTAAKRGVGSFLTIDLVDDAKTDWHFWVYLSDWQIWKDDIELLDSDNVCNDDYARVLSMFIGETLLRSEAEDDNDAFTLHFSGAIEMFVSDASDLYGDGQQLMLIFRDKTFLTAFRGGIGLNDSDDKEP